MKKNESGFTLIELMVTIAMTSIVIVIIYSAYAIQTKIYTEQDKTAEMQQNLRAGMAFLQREARMAGYNPNNVTDSTCSAPAVPSKVEPGIHTATKTTFGFSMDLDGDGKCDGVAENVTYQIATNKLSRTARYPDSAAHKPLPVAENIADIDFVYIISSTGTTPPTSTPGATQLDDILSVQIALLAQAKTPDRTPAQTTSFLVLMPDESGAPTAAVSRKFGDYNDSFRRRLLTATINCRNMGLR